ncbi:MAG: cation acetate symporter [Oceanicaulis sp.]|jgi:cation/acetate symporter|uniref:sodium:solute symporter family protein n=1 Tax=unclassified Oceanicaulis TaxID=2632123 RepID=UPI0000668C35|nr:MULTISPECIES: sodium:solute symporter family protein [unclassified Oceanicaulis]EAP90373.1 sodium:solute symporter family protein [Oceanicaulis alexandrii HTCC2633] [Oceanicaulis sp. HTCC2633]MAB70707.1 cation acetate symporter [Oceanicaulis sp.]MBC37839.1 cation acetate symporter [Oceanicaulis sp.]MBG34596.1 cation acetate symporter [Oceanicaulis sp.]HBU63260.1 cation acetate symporter [Oceanicaulis sp.]|tara:strand:+ start:237 stop:2177 length:1941 start_codon:yes stop_codon:yes gene_type:complete
MEATVLGLPSTLFWTAFFVIGTFGLYIGIAVWARAASTDDFYVAGHDVHPVFNGMATAADWMSAASFLSMAGIVAFSGYDGSVYLMGWTGGYVLLALLLAPYLRKFGKFTVPDFVGDRYYSQAARIVAVICALFISFTYIAGQMRGVGIAFSNFLGVDITIGVIIGAIIVLFYAVLGGMKGITYTQVAQYCVLIFAYTVPAIFLSLSITGTPLPQLGFIGNTADGTPLLVDLDRTLSELGFASYLDGQKSMIDVFAITVALMVGTAGLPHVIIRFFTVPKASDARKSAGWALVFIALLYTTAPAVAVFARSNFIETVNESVYSEEVARGDARASAMGEDATPQWFYNWENTGLLEFTDKNGDGRIQYRADPETNEMTRLDRDIFVLANPEIGGLPGWVIGLVVAGGLAAALSTAAGLLMVISSAVSHDLCRKVLFKNMSDTQELLVARLAAVGAVLVAIYAGINPPGFVAAVVAFAFGLAAASFFPVIFLGIFWKRMNKEGAIAGMLIGLSITAAYIVHFKIGFSSVVLGVVALIIGIVLLIMHFGLKEQGDTRAMLIGSIVFGLIFLGGVFGVLPDFAIGTANQWFLGVSPEGFGAIGMVISFAVSIIVSLATKAPPEDVQNMVEEIRLPSKAAHVSHPGAAPAE